MLISRALSAESTTNWTISLLQVTCGAILMAIMAQISIPLPFTVVPFTLQTLTALTLGAVLGPRKGAAAVVTYLGLIGCGFPVIAGGIASPLALTGLHAGYLFGMVAQAFVFGYAVECLNNRWFILVAAMAACALQLAMGTLWLGLFLGQQTAFLQGFLPFIMGEAFKAFLVTISIRLCRLT